MVLDDSTLEAVEVLAWYIHDRDRSLKPNISGALRRLLDASIKGEQSKNLMKRAWERSRVTYCEACSTTHVVPYCYAIGKALDRAQ